MKRRMAKCLFSVVFGLLLFEGVCSGWAWWSYGTLDVARLNELDVGNDFLKQLAPDETSMASIYAPHPYFGFVLNKRIETFRPDFPRRHNNVGLVGQDVPLRRDDRYFTILMTGGSVAHQFAELGHLDRLLAERYLLDKPVRILNVTNGGWRQPNQAIAVLLYGDVADAVLTLDGFNEHYSFLDGNRQRLEMPGSTFDQLNPIVEHGEAKLAASAATNSLRRFSERHASRAIFLLTKALRERIVADVGSLEPTRANCATYFALPKDWDAAERRAFNGEQYRKYVRLIHAMTDELAIKEAHFVQPCPAIGKKLTAQERVVVRDLGYADAYRGMTDELLTLNERGIPVVALLDCFEGVEQTIYADQIHCDRQGRGYAIMADRIANELGKLWKLKPRETVVAH